MNKVICDVCGTDYPETASQCPVCGCVRRGGSQTSAGNATANSESAAGYTYVKGGRFSKSNVRKRLKAAPVPPQPRQASSKPRPKNVPQPAPQDMDDEDEY